MKWKIIILLIIVGVLLMKTSNSETITKEVIAKKDLINKSVNISNNNFIINYGNINYSLAPFVNINNNIYSFNSISAATLSQLNIKNVVTKLDDYNYKFGYNITKITSLNSVGYSYKNFKYNSHQIYNENVRVDFSDLINAGYNITINETNIVISNLNTGINDLDPIIMLNGSSFVNDGLGSRGWTNPQNVATSNNVYATITVPARNIVDSDSLVVTGFNFNIPSGSAINGIKAEVERKKTTSGSVQDVALSIYYNGDVIGDSNDFLTWSTTEAYYTYGSYTDLWNNNTAITVAKVNSDTFGFGVAASLIAGSTTSLTASIDHIRLSVNYTAPASSGSCTQSSFLTIGFNNTFLNQAVVIDSCNTNSSVKIPYNFNYLFSLINQTGGGLILKRI